MLRYIEKAAAVALFLQRQPVRGVIVQAELPGTELLTSGLHLQADCGAVLLAGFAGLHGDSFPEVGHPVRGQGVDGRQDGGVCVLVGVWQPGLLRDAEARGGLRGRPGGVVGRVCVLLVRRPAAVEAVLSLGAARGVGPGTALAHPVFVRHAGAGGGGGRVARGSAGRAALTRQREGGALGGHGGRLPGRVLGGVVVVVGEARLVGGGVGVAAAGGDAAGRAQAGGVAVTVGTGEGQRHDGVDSLGHGEVALLHLVLGKLAVGRDLDAGALQGRGSVRADAGGREVAGRPHVILAVVSQGLRDGDGYSGAGLQAVVLGRKTGVAQ